MGQQDVEGREALKLRGFGNSSKPKQSQEVADCIAERRAQREERRGRSEFFAAILTRKDPSCCCI